MCVVIAVADLRDEMPETAEFIDALRDAFGKEEIDGQIRRGMRGEPTFYAQENGREVGTKMPQEVGVTPTTFTAPVEEPKKGRWK